MTNCVDISKYTSPRDVQAIDRLCGAGVELCIIQAHPAGYGRESSTQLFIAASLHRCNRHTHGMSWDAYIYGYCAFPDWTEGALDTLNGSGLRPLRIWYDIEDVNEPAKAMTVSGRVAAYNRDLRLIDNWSADRDLPRPGVYSGKWYFDQYLPGVTVWADRDLWDSDYDGVPDVEYGFRPYGGWTARAIKQHVGTSSLAGVSGLDQNALSTAELRRVMQGEVDVPVPQKYIDKFGEGVTWEGVADNLEGIIGQVMEERDMARVQLQECLGSDGDAQERLDRLREALQSVLAT